MKLSIIVPVYNVEKYLPTCIKSIVEQKYDDIEIVLVDDGSTDNCGAICDEWAIKDPRIKVVHKNNGGVASAWLCGIEHSTGEMIGFVDSDDFCDDDYFLILMNKQIKENADIVIGGYSIDKADSNYFKPIASSILKAGVYEGSDLDYIKDNIFKVHCMLDWARWVRVIKRELLLQNLYLVDNRIRVGDDMGIAIATLFDAKKIALTENTGYHYVQHDSSIMHSVSFGEIENFDLLCANIENICSVKHRDNYIYREFTSQMLVVIKKILRSDCLRKDKIQMLKKLRESPYVKNIYKNKDYGKKSFKVKVCIKLFKGRHFRLMSLI